MHRRKVVAAMVDVLLATYHPNDVWLKEQIDSIRAQRGVGINLIMRDDPKGEGACANFNALLKMSDGDYAAFSDQDDVWQEEKLAKMMSRMLEVEAERGRDVPILVFCDSVITDETLHPMSGTLISRSGVNVRRGLRVERLLMQNFISGHAMLINAALRRKVGDIPQDAIMHDYWIALVAAAFGVISFLDDPLVMYRQHSSQALGAMGKCHSTAGFRSRLAHNILQAKAFCRRYGAECPECVRALSRIDAMTWWGKRLEIVRHGLFKSGLRRNLGVFVLI